MAKKKAAKTPEKFITYRGGKKIELLKRADQFVARQLPDELQSLDSPAIEQMSSASTRITCPPERLDKMMEAAREAAPAHHAYEEAESHQPFLITDRVIVTFDEGYEELAVAEFAAEYALEIVRKLSESDYLFRLTNDTGINPVKLVRKLTEEDDRVVNVDHDLNQVFKTSSIVPTDPRYSEQWHLHRRMTPSGQYDPRSSANVEAAWELLGHLGDADVVVGVTDDGCQLDHDDFESPGKFPAWGYFEGSTLHEKGDIGARPAKMYEDGANHGTACCGVIGANADGDMTVGASAGCRLAPIKWESSGPSLFISDSKVSTALDYLDSRVDIVSNSWGSSPVSTWSSHVLNKIDRMAETGGRRGKGIVFLWAAGNENCPISHTASVPVPFTSGWGRFSWIGVETAQVFSDDLANRASVMKVAALSSTAQRSHYSCYGPGIDITAPSSNSHDYHRLTLPGLGIVTAKGRDAVRDNFGGTSSATPLVAAVAALVISANDSLTAAEVMQILKQTASKDLNMTDWPKTPPASFDRDTSWDVSPVAPFDAGDFTDVGSADGTWSPWFGHGKVDAHAAVSRALELLGDDVVSLSVSREANQRIPDDNPVGVTSSINVQEHGSVSSIVVNVDITHTWRGDLRVILRGPNGSEVVLHDRSGGRADDIRRSYSTDDIPSLATFHGVDVNGVWSLHVSDHAGADLGSLDEWGIDFEVLRPSEIRVESRPALLIPDNDPTGVSDQVSIAVAEDIDDIAVEVDITHSWRGDLRVSLTSPAGDTVLLHNRTGSQADNIRQTYTLANKPELGDFIGQSTLGAWTLEVSDHAGEDLGKLNRWALVIR